jgi:hypothetical protein
MLMPERYTSMDTRTIVVQHDMLGVTPGMMKHFRSWQLLDRLEVCTMHPVMYLQDSVFCSMF